MIKIATVLLSSLPVSMILRQSGIISVEMRNSMTAGSSFLTRAPMTPKQVKRKYSKGLALLDVLRQGYKYNGI